MNVVSYGRILLAVLLSGLLSSCGGGGSSSNNTTSAPSPTTNMLASAASVSLTVPSLAANQLAVTVEQDPSLSAYQTINLPYVTVTICDANHNCQTIDHIVVDTGSYGLRVLRSAITNSSMSLTPETVGSDSVGECTSFLDGFMWGSVNLATVQLNGETATQIPIQVVGDTAVSGISRPPTSCASNGPDESNLAGIGGNGILGVGLFTIDKQQYYICYNGSCMSYGSPGAEILQATQQVSNPVPYFSVDNNGVILQMPPLPEGGAGSASGMLTFGVGTETDNQPPGLQWLAADSGGNISVTVQGMLYSSSFIDSGSNFYYVPLTGVTTDVYGNYTPAQPTNYSLSLAPNVGTGSVVPQSMLVANPAQIPSSSMAMDDVDINVTQVGSADLGVPFFYGKSLAFVINGHAVSGVGSGPLYGVAVVQ